MLGADCAITNLLKQAIPENWAKYTPCNQLPLQSTAMRDATFYQTLPFAKCTGRPPVGIGTGRVHQGLECPHLRGAKLCAGMTGGKGYASRSGTGGG